MNTKLVVLHFLNDILSVFSMALALFWSAGRIDWWPAWAAIAVWLAFFAVMDAVLLRRPDLMLERLIPPPGAKAWDRAILSILRLAQLARYILAGLDQRHGWTGEFPMAAQIAGIVFCVLGYALLIWATASNDFFSQIVRIQPDRRQTVVTGGPYRWVRHPAYIGMILFELAMSTLLASWPALIAGGFCAALIVLRTVLEERTLQAELAGYAGYVKKVHYRLIPGIW